MAKRSRAESVSSVELNSDAVLSSRATSLSPSPAEHHTHSAKYLELDCVETSSTEKPVIMRCYLPPHQPASFTSYEDYDVHYQKFHTNRCSECHKNFPSDHYLNLHIAENHDPINEARRARGEKTYGCFVEGCERYCSTPQKRRRHVIDKHNFPAFYDFFIVNDGIDKRTSMIRPSWQRQQQHRQRRRSSGAVEEQKKTDDAMDLVENERTSKIDDSPLPGLQSSQYSSTVSKASSPSPSKPSPPTSPPASAPDETMTDLTSSLSALRFVPSSVRFGRGGGVGRGRGRLARS